MSNELEVKRPIEIKDNSKERVAFDLMQQIANYDSTGENDKTTRKYWLTLYSQCLKATSGYGLERALKED